MFAAVFVLAIALSVSARSGESSKSSESSESGEHVSLQLRFSKKIAFSETRTCCVPPWNESDASAWNHLPQWWILHERRLLHTKR